MPVIEMMNLTKNYSKARGIVDLNLNIEEGEFSGLSVRTEPVNLRRFGRFWG